MGVNNLPKVVTWQHSGQGSNSRSWVTSPIPYCYSIEYTFIMYTFNQPAWHACRVGYIFYCCLFHYYLRRRRRLCFRCGLFVCLSIGLLANLWTDFYEIFWRGRAWLKDQVIQFWWRSGSRFGSGSPKSEIQILRIGRGLCCLSISSSFYILNTSLGEKTNYLRMYLTNLNQWPSFSHGNQFGAKLAKPPSFIVQDFKTDWSIAMLIRKDEMAMTTLYLLEIWQASIQYRNSWVNETSMCTAGINQYLDWFNYVCYCLSHTDFYYCIQNVKINRILIIQDL